MGERFCGFGTIVKNSPPAKLLEAVRGMKNGEGHIRRKLIYSMGLALASAAVYKGVEISILTGLTKAPYLIEIVGNSPYVMFGGSLAADYITSLIGGFQNLRFLENPRIGTSPNLLATSAYYTSKKMIPTHKTARDVLTAIVPSFFCGNAFLIAPALVSKQVLIRGAAAKLLTTGLNMVQMAGKEAVLRGVGRRKGNINAEGVVFESAGNIKK